MSTLNENVLLGINRSGVIAISLAEDASRLTSHHMMQPEHLLLGLMDAKESLAHFLLKEYGLKRKELVAALEDELGNGFGSWELSWKGVWPSRPTKTILYHAVDDAQFLGEGLAAPENILLSLLEEYEDLIYNEWPWPGTDEYYRRGIRNQFFDNLNLDRRKMHREISRYIKNLKYMDKYNPDEIYTKDNYLSMEEVFKANTKVWPEEEKKDKKEKIEDIDLAPAEFVEHTKDLTREASEGKIDPTIGRDKEIMQVLQILGRRRKNNPILIGEPGVGKTAIAEGLALLSVRAGSPDILQGKKFILLDVGGLLSGTSYRGQFEQRLQIIFDELRRDNDKILFIDEMHTIIGAGAVDGAAMDAASFLKPALSRGEFQCIGATTLDEYRKYIEKDRALARRFQPVQVGEPTVEDAIKILHRVKVPYEQYHNVIYTPAALEAAVRLSSQYIPDRFLPDKAIDLIDEAGARANLGDGSHDAPPIGAPSTEIAELYDIKKLYPNDTRTRITQERIATVVSDWTGVPVNKISKAESKKLMNFEVLLKKKILGQDYVIHVVSRTLRGARVGLRNPDRPIASFLFAGPTGVGKTELAKEICENFFGFSKALIRLDMSEYMEKHNVAKLIGAAPGYVGYEEGGQLTDAVRRSPFSMVLFDEIEKAHEDIYNVLLQILEDGRLTDAKGHLVDFKNTIIIITSNVGASEIKQTGFDAYDGFIEAQSEELFSNIAMTHNKTYKLDPPYEKMIASVKEELKKGFRPELLNRLDEILVFRPLTLGTLRKISDIMIDDLCKRAAEKSIILEVSASAREAIVEEAYDTGMYYGARPIRRVIAKRIEDQLALEFLKRKTNAPLRVWVELNQRDEISLQFIKP